jgi:hypothetical protein
MAYSDAVYDPPRAGLPHAAVVFAPDGQVLGARTVPSVAAGESFLAQIMTEFAKKTWQSIHVE